MKYIFQTNFLNLLILIIIISVISIWSANRLTEWNTDYGLYYAGSYFLEENYNLYDQFFSHKGPLYFLFLKFIGYIIGWGTFQAYLSLIITILFFYIPLYFLLISQRLKAISLIAGTLLSLCLLYRQDSNASLSFFQSGFLLMSFWLLVNNSKNFIKLSISYVLYICSILIRVDTIVYFPVYILSLILINYPISIITLIKNLFIWLVLSICIFSSLLLIFNFNISSYIIHNFEFNLWYSVKISSCNSLSCTLANYIYRPTAFGIVTGSLLIIPIFLLLPLLKISFFELLLSFKNILQNNGVKRHIDTNIYGLIFLSIGLITWFLTASDRNYHVLILLVPLIFFYIINFRKFNSLQCKLLILVSTFGLIVILSYPAYKIYKDPTCLFSPYCSSSNMKEYSDSINFLKSLPDESVTVVGGDGWLYFFSNKKPSRSINDLWLYTFDDYFITAGLKKQHEKILKMKQGEKFLIYNRLADQSNTKNQLLKQILNKSELIQRHKFYSVYKIK
tara:strand:- start:1056 stop:2573 length:1518 start_codon:yes stop_codon:yes gene_type:complete